MVRLVRLCNSARARHAADLLNSFTKPPHSNHSAHTHSQTNMLSIRGINNLASEGKDNEVLLATNDSSFPE